MSKEVEKLKPEGEEDASVLEFLSRYKWWIVGGIGAIAVIVILMKRRSEPEYQPPPWHSGFPREPELPPRRPVPMAPPAQVPPPEPAEPPEEEEDSDFEEKSSRVISVEDVRPQNKNVEVKLEREEPEPEPEPEPEEEEEDLPAERCAYVFKRGEKIGKTCRKYAMKGKFCSIHAPKSK